MHQSTVKVLFTDGAWQRSQATLDKMEKLRLALVDTGFEAYWSTAIKKDKRNFGLFYFTPVDGRADTLDPKIAGDWIIQLCEDKGHPTVGQCGDLKRDRQKNQRLTKTVKFAHPPSVRAFEKIAIDIKSWEFQGYEVVYEPPQTVIFPTNAATIATTGISSVDPVGLVAELWAFVDEYIEEKGLHGNVKTPDLLGDGRIEFGKIFAISCSTLDLAYYICSKQPIVGTPYELVYKLNE